MGTNANMLVTGGSEMKNGQLATLILEIAAADRSALSRLYDATSPELFGMISGVFTSPEKADQVLLDVYTDVWRHAASFMPGSQPVRVWLRSLVSLRALESLRPTAEGPATDRNVPPEYVKDLLMARIDREPRSAALREKPAGDPAARAVGAGQAPVAPGAMRLFAPWVLAAAALIFALLFLYKWRAVEQAHASQSEELVTARAATEESRGRLETAAARGADLDRINGILGSAGARVLGLEGLPPGQAPAVAILWDVRAGQWLVTGYLQPPPSEKVYRLWMLIPGERRSIATLNTDATGRIFTLTRVPDPLPRPATLQVTLEPTGGSAEPSSPVRALGRIM
jgi:hypothetical protein